jgi:hypothetical protein
MLLCSFATDNKHNSGDLSLINHDLSQRLRSK